MVKDINIIANELLSLYKNEKNPIYWRYTTSYKEEEDNMEIIASKIQDIMRKDTDFNKSGYWIIYCSIESFIRFKITYSQQL